MVHVYSAFYAPMVRMNAPSGIPTEVRFLFVTILRRLVKDYQPDYSQRLGSECQCRSRSRTRSLTGVDQHQGNKRLPPPKRQMKDVPADKKDCK